MPVKQTRLLVRLQLHNATHIHRVSQQPCNGLAWDESNRPGNQPDQPRADTSHGSQPAPFHNGQKLQWKNPKTEFGKDLFL